MYLTSRFHVAVRLFSNRSQMTSKCGKNKEVYDYDAKLSYATFCKGPRMHGDELFFLTHDAALRIKIQEISSTFFI